MRHDRIKRITLVSRILKEGLEKGEQKGLQQGLQQVLQQGETSLILRQLGRRFGQIELTTEQKIKTLSIPQLETVGESLLDFSSKQDLLDWLEGIN